MVRCSMMHAQGSSSKSLSGGALSGGSEGMSGIGFHGILNASSGLAQLCAPPHPPVLERLAFWKLFLMVIFYPVGIFYYLFIHLPNQGKKQRAYQAALLRYENHDLRIYQKKWICLDCGTIREFDLTTAGFSPTPPVHYID